VHTKSPTHFIELITPFYKGSLFLCAGAVIHAVADNQDFRKYGGLVSYLPMTYLLMLTTSLSLVAFPGLLNLLHADAIVGKELACQSR